MVKKPERDESRGNGELDALVKAELGPELEVLRKLGRGSVASVYLAREQELKRLVAVKVMAPKLALDERARRRFEREAQAAAALSHPNIVAVYRVGRFSNGIPYIVMQYVKGRTLADRLVAQGSLTVPEARDVLSEVAAALAAAHQKGIVHRDVRPGNILYEEDTGHSLLSDFGIVAILPSADAQGSARLTRTGELVGDPEYMSPEQLKGGEITERSDVYAIGLLGYKLLTGRGPYDATSRREQLTAHLQQEPRRLSELLADAEPELEELLIRCLAKEPAHRPNSADLAQRLKAGPAAATPAFTPALARPGRGGLFSRLMERRLPQITGAYALVAWLLLQVVDQLADRDVLPEVAYRLVLVAAVTGLPAVLTGAWFHGKRGRQKVEAVEYWVFGALGLIWLAVSALILVGWRGG